MSEHTHKMIKLVGSSHTDGVSRLAGRVRAAGSVDGVGSCPPTAPRHNLTGDPYFTDGQRAVILLAATRSA